MAGSGTVMRAAGWSCLTLMTLCWCTSQCPWQAPVLYCTVDVSPGQTPSFRLQAHHQGSSAMVHLNRGSCAQRALTVAPP